MWGDSRLVTYIFKKSNVLWKYVGRRRYVVYTCDFYYLFEVSFPILYLRIGQVNMSGTHDDSIMLTYSPAENLAPTHIKQSKNVPIILLLIKM